MPKRQATDKRIAPPTPPAPPRARRRKAAAASRDSGKKGVRAKAKAKAPAATHSPASSTNQKTLPKKKSESAIRRKNRTLVHELNQKEDALADASQQVHRAKGKGSEFPADYVPGTSYADSLWQLKQDFKFLMLGFNVCIFTFSKRHSRILLHRLFDIRCRIHNLVPRAGSHPELSKLAGAGRISSSGDFLAATGAVGQRSVSSFFGQSLLCLLGWPMVAVFGHNLLVCFFLLAWHHQRLLLKDPV